MKSNYWRRGWIPWVVGGLIIITVISIVRAADYPERDAWGHVFPRECRRDLSYLLNRIEIKRNWNLGKTNDDRKTIGYWWKPNDPTQPEVIYIDKSIVNKGVQEDIIKHELCHAEMFRLYGDPYWHKE